MLLYVLHAEKVHQITSSKTTFSKKVQSPKGDATSSLITRILPRHANAMTSAIVPVFISADAPFLLSKGSPYLENHSAPIVFHYAKRSIYGSPTCGWQIIQSVSQTQTIAFYIG